MELLYLSTFATIFCTIFVFSLKYLSLLRWISGRAYVLRQNQEKVTAEEVLDLIKSAKPFPVSCQRGWKIHSYVHDHRLWFHFLTIPNNNTASLKVFAVFSKLRASPQSVLQLLKDISMTCEWKPGVVATSYVHDVSSHDVPAKSKDLPSMPVKHDIIKEERVCRRPSRPFDAWWQPNITQTTTEEYRRFWHREDNGCCWLLQMNEKQQAWTFYLAQPVEEVDQSLVSMVTWSSNMEGNASGEMAAAKLGSLREFLHMRKMQATPLLTLSLPKDVSGEHPQDSSTPKSEQKESKPEGRRSNKLLTRFKSFIEKTAQSNNASKVEAQKEEIKKYSTILKFGSSASAEKLGSESMTSNMNGENCGETAQCDVTGSEGDEQVTADTVKENGKQLLQRSVSDSSALQQAARRKNQTQNISEALLEDPSDPADPAVVCKYKTLANQAAAELLAQVLKASNTDLDKLPEDQLTVAGGWMFYGFESEVVILKKLFKTGTYVQSYLGKGVVEAPPQTVWDAVRNPRTRFTYDESLKKVDILQTLSDTLRIVYMYHEVHQILKKESCDICMLQSERIEGEKYILVYQSVEWDSAQPKDDTVRATLLPSGWIIEPVLKDKKVFSMVTYLMQVDVGAPRPASDKMPFEDMVSKQPLSITFLQQYLQPAMLLARRQSQ